jgi:hypothetical protein
MTPRVFLVSIPILFGLLLSSARADVPGAIASPGDAVMTVHAEGAQIYECKADSTGKLVWQFREPIATLLIDGKTVGRHYAGPSWELADGSAVTGKVSAHSPRATAQDQLLPRLPPFSAPDCPAIAPAQGVRDHLIL